MNNPDSRQQGLWIDHPDALAVIQAMQEQNRITNDEVQQLRNFIRDGFLIIRKAVDHRVIQRIHEDLETCGRRAEQYIIRSSGDGYNHPTADALHNKSRFIDFHVHSETARKAILATAISRFLAIIFEEAPLAFQTLLFRYGSEQAIHKDTAYVVVDRPLALAASWIALEDIQEGSGELLYYKGSHRIPDFRFSEKDIHWVPARDGQEQHQTFLDYLHEKAREQSLPLEKFHPEKGDALIWHAGLAHGGAEITSNSSRYSLVTHYCPVSCQPNYFRFAPQTAIRVPFGKLGFYSSRHYDLQHGSKNPYPIFMGGKPARNPVTGFASRIKRLFRPVSK